jgi:DNA-binding MarR family transcriptional regulator
MDRPDLGALAARLVREIIRREQPIFDRAGLAMWDYIVLTALDTTDASSQAELSASTGRDKTRLIGHLDLLEDRGLLTRSVDPVDRRNRIVAITAAGRRLLRRVRAQIRAAEDDLLAAVAPRDRETFERVLTVLAGPDANAASAAGGIENARPASAR